MAITHELIAKAGTYKTKDGTEKTRWHKCGVAMTTSSGGTALNIESLPTNFDGWLQMREPKPKDDYKVNSQSKGVSEQEFEESIPF